jgi:acetyl esterase/lipase
VQRLGEGDAGAPAAQWLFCPMLDDRTAADRALDAVDHRVWNNVRNRFGWRSYLGAEPGAAEPPAFSVPGRREQPAGLPPAWIGVGDIDLFHAENRSYAARLREVDVPAEFHVVAGAPHGFETWAARTRPARAFVGAAQEWLGRTLAV